MSTAAGALEREVRARGPWYHNLHLPGGVETCPDHFLGDFPRFKWERLAPAIPERLDGWTALDVGCNAGFYAFELAKRGARVTAIDGDEHYLDQARWAARIYGLDDRIEFRRLQVYDLARSDERFDLVLFLGVFYHLRYPLLGLDAVARTVDRLLVFQSLMLPGEDVEGDADPDLAARDRLLRPGWPRMAFIERRLQRDPTNWWAPNHAAVAAMLRSTGMAIVARPADETYVCRPDREGETSFWTWDADEFFVAAGRAAPESGGGTGPRKGTVPE